VASSRPDFPQPRRQETFPISKPPHDPELRFDGRTVLVTGSGRNLGRAIVLEFAARGAAVIVNARSNRDEVEEVVAAAKHLGARAIGVLGDASEAGVLAEIKQRAESTLGPVDIYVSNAARRFMKSFWDTTDEDWQYYLNQQLTASWRLAQTFAPRMREAGFGRIIHINGPDGYKGMWDRIPHSVGKRGLRTLTKSLAQGFGEFGITVNDINPGFSATQRDLTTHPQFAEKGLAERLVAAIPIRRQTALDEVAFACAFLASKRAGAITGSIIHIDGGMDRLG
jgi:NAD(P)-dependent dehydrogenase (short-subunit alcohol dehydrogenase family)